MKYILYMINNKTNATTRLGEYKSIKAVSRDKDAYTAKYNGYTFRIKGVMV